MKKLALFLILFISFSAFSQNSYISESVKTYVYSRDGGKCQCCGKTSDIEYDHIKPFSCGGTSAYYNIQLLCGSCNRSKSNGNICHKHNKVVGKEGCEGKQTQYAKKYSPTKYKTTSSASRQCSGTTQSGNRCKNKTKSASGRCHHHD